MATIRDCFFSFLHNLTLCLCMISILAFPAFPSWAAPVRQHIVQPGETLVNIAEMYGYSPFNIASVNHLNMEQSLMVGQRITLPEDLLSRNSVGSYAQGPHHAQRQQGEAITTRQKKILSDAPYAYFGNGDPVTNVLKSFASNYRLPVIISEDVSGSINGKIGPLSPVAFLDELAQLNSLLWYFDGDTLYVYNAREIEKKIINLDYLSTASLRNTLMDMGVWDSRYGWRERPREGLVYISGPPRYMELVSQTATLLDTKAGDRQRSEKAFKVFALKYAWAEDHTISYRNQQITIPGVATLLKQIVLKGNTKVLDGSNSPTKAQSVKPAIPITGKQPPKLALQNNQASQKNNSSSLPESGEDLLINADRRSNSIIIHDLASKMPMYESLIRTLDKPLSQIEINVSVIDVDTNSIDELGVNWKLDSTNGKSFFRFDPSSSLSSGPASTILKVTPGRLLAQVRMLATKNKAKILSRPSVLTLDNMEAVLDNNQTFYVKVQGGDANSNTAQLYPITSGSVLKVTPRIVKETDSRKIHLDVNIQDGTSETTSTLGSDVTLPIVKNTTISTQAMIDENESLLVGGYFYEKKSTKVEKVPFLGDIPIMGQLFRQNSDQHVKNVRLFLITPKIVNM